ncbi:probable low affinity copper uptake protein 2 isoform X4 [Canis lupus familiaris]|uniref:probable low affinity copper uptake protein 2 isoform X4 n=3 Tax=Canis lupus TaxID=9612 RepID=UPI0018F5557D|nr:probable low affinity copper uptake protein 2 isoform X4 [Canis lupus familiaris]
MNTAQGCAAQHGDYGYYYCMRVAERMHFIFSNEVVLLFDFWSVHSPAGMALSVLVVLFLAVLYESIKVGKAKLLYWAVVSMSIPASQLTEETDQDSSGSDSPPVSTTRLSSRDFLLKPACAVWSSESTAATSVLSQPAQGLDVGILCLNKAAVT